MDNDFRPHSHHSSESAEHAASPRRIGRIVLAYEPMLRIGRLIMEPPMRRITHEDGRDEILEPRVMQVLVALVKSGGAIFTRDDLIRCCWDGRIVGDDAINRVMSRLRRTAEGIGFGIFRVETINKVGYRLTEEKASNRASATSTPIRTEPPGTRHESAYVMVTIEAGAHCTDLIGRLKTVPGVGLIHSLTGPVDLLVRLDGESMAEINKSRAALTAIPGVLAATSAVLLERYLG